MCLLLLCLESSDELFAEGYWIVENQICDLVLDVVVSLLLVPAPKCLILWFLDANCVCYLPWGCWRLHWICGPVLCLG